MEDTHVTDPDKIEKMLFVLAIAFCRAYESVRKSTQIAFWLFFRILTIDASPLLSRVYELASMTNLQKNSSKIDCGYIY